MTKITHTLVVNMFKLKPRRMPPDERVLVFVAPAGKCLSRSRSYQLSSIAIRLTVLSLMSRKLSG
jgi:hypothetical protein